MPFEQSFPSLEYLYWNLQALILLSILLLSRDESVVAIVLRVSRQDYRWLVIPTGEYTVGRKCYSPSGKKFVV
jgi:hypothetical protein